MKIRVAHGARRHEVTIPGSTTVAELKEKLQPLTGVPPEAQDLQIMGDSLCDEASLAEQGVQNLDKLELVAAGSPPPRIPQRGARTAAPSESAELRPSSATAAAAAAAAAAAETATITAASRDASPKLPHGGDRSGCGGSGSSGGSGGSSGGAPLAAALRTLDGVVAELDTMDSQANIYVYVATPRRPRH